MHASRQQSIATHFITDIIGLDTFQVPSLFSLVREGQPIIGYLDRGKKIRCWALIHLFFP
jgi:hypothetical protein